MTDKKYDVSFIAEAPKEDLMVFYGTKEDMEWLRHILYTDFHSKRQPWQRGEAVDVMNRAKRMGFHKEAEQMEDDILSEFGPEKSEDL